MAVVADIMSTALLTVEPATALAAAARRMNERRVGAVLVLEEARLVGILTERDVLRAVALGFGEDDRVDGWMTKHPETIDPADTTEHASVLMIHGGFRHLPVVDGEAVVGMLSIRDLMRVVLQDSAPRGV